MHPPHSPTHAIGTCPGCGRGTATPTHSPTITVTCPDCATTFTLNLVHGTVTDQECNAACMYAHGPSCDCACGGENHGAGFLPTRTAPTWVLDRDRDRHARKQAAATARRAARTARITTLLDAHPHLAPLADPNFSSRSGFLTEIGHTLRRDGHLTGRQIHAAERALDAETARAEERTRNLELDRQGVTVPTGRLTVTGTIETTSCRTSRHGMTWKALVRTAQGWAFRVTLPKSVLDVAEAEHAASLGRTPSSAATDRAVARLHGRALTLTATFEPGGEPLLGYATRPTGAAVAPAA